MIHSSNSLDQTRFECSNETTNSIDNVDLYSAGWFDGLTGLNAELPHFKDYWNGYQLGYREYCCGLMNVEIPEGEANYLEGIAA